MYKRYLVLAYRQAIGRFKQDTRHRYNLYIKSASVCRMSQYDLSLVGQTQQQH